MEHSPPQILKRPPHNTGPVQPHPRPLPRSVQVCPEKHGWNAHNGPGPWQSGMPSVVVVGQITSVAEVLVVDVLLVVTVGSLVDVVGHGSLRGCAAQRSTK